VPKRKRSWRGSWRFGCRGLRRGISLVESRHWKILVLGPWIVRTLVADSISRITLHDLSTWITMIPRNIAWLLVSRGPRERGCRQRTPGYEEQNAGQLRIRVRCPPSLVIMSGITCHQAPGALWLSGTAFGSRFVQRRGTGAEI
jgi:hypothetical protein